MRRGKTRRKMIRRRTMSRRKTMRRIRIRMFKISHDLLPLSSMMVQSLIMIIHG